MNRRLSDPVLVHSPARSSNECSCAYMFAGAVSCYGASRPQCLFSMCLCMRVEATAGCQSLQNAHVATCRSLTVSGAVRLQARDWLMMALYMISMHKLCRVQQHASHVRRCSLRCGGALVRLGLRARAGRYGQAVDSINRHGAACAHARQSKTTRTHAS